MAAYPEVRTVITPTAKPPEIGYLDRLSGAVATADAIAVVIRSLLRRLDGEDDVLDAPGEKAGTSLAGMLSDLEGRLRDIREMIDHLSNRFYRF